MLQCCSVRCRHMAGCELALRHYYISRGTLIPCTAGHTRLALQRDRRCSDVPSLWQSDSGCGGGPTDINAPAASGARRDLISKLTRGAPLGALHCAWLCSSAQPESDPAVPAALQLQLIGLVERHRIGGSRIRQSVQVGRVIAKCNNVHALVLPWRDLTSGSAELHH